MIYHTVAAWVSMCNAVQMGGGELLEKGMHTDGQWQGGQTAVRRMNDDEAGRKWQDGWITARWADGGKMSGQQKKAHE